MSVDHLNPKVAADALVFRNIKRAEANDPLIDLTDPEEVTYALQNLYDLSYTDADELGQPVYEILCSR